MTTLATDDFNRANAANLGASWTVPTNGNPIAIASNVATATHDAEDDPFLEYYNGVSFPNDQWAQVTVGATVDGTSDTGVGPAVRVQSGGDLYFLQGNSVETRVYKRVSNGYTQLGSDGPSVAAGNTLYLEVQGTTIIAKKNGSSICGSPISDSGVASGSAGAWNFPHGSGGTATFDDWSGGDFGSGDTLMPQIWM